MKKSLILFSVIFIGFLVITAAGKGKEERLQDMKALDLSVQPQDIKSTGSVKPDLDFGKFPLYFIFNKGQVNEKAKFYAKASRYTLWLTKEGLIFDSIRGQGSGVSGQGDLPHSPHSPHSPKLKDESPFSNSPHSPTHLLTKYARDVSRLSFIGANKNPEIVPIDETQLKVNYFIGNDRSKWHCDIPTSQAVLYKNLYRNIDLKVYGIEKQIEYDWIVKPWGNPEDIIVEYKNVKGTRIDGEGNLLIETDFGELMHKKPISYQEISMEHGAWGMEEKTFVEVKFKKIKKNTYGFEVGEYDRSYELIIDPVVLAYSTYLGGHNSDYGMGIAADSSGNVYVTGYTYSTNFPTKNQYQTDQSDSDVFVTKIDTTKTGTSSLIYSTYLGGNNYDYGLGITADSRGNVYVTGFTSSTNFPTKNQYQDDQSTTDAFVTKIDTTKTGSSSLIYSTYLGGSSSDYGRGIAADSSGNVYVTGYTYSTNFPTKNQYQDDQSYSDAFVTKIDTTKTGSSSLIYTTYLGGNNYDEGYGIAADSSGNVYVTGYTESTNFPTKNQYQDDPGDSTYDAFVTKIDTTTTGNSSLIYSTYLGGNSYDEGYGIAADSSGNVYVTGNTYSTNFPTKNQYQDDQSGNDAFVTKIDTTTTGNSSLIYSTYLGGNNYDEGRGIAADSSGNVYVTGYTYSTNFPTKNQYQDDQSYSDAFVTKIDTTKIGSSGLIYSTYLGGNNTDCGWSIAADSSGDVYVTGYTYSTDFPTKNQYQSDELGTDAFVTRLEFEEPSITVISPNGGESWTLGSFKNITWDAFGISGNVKIILLKDGTKIGTIADNIGSASGSYSWTVGQHDSGTGVPGSGYKIKIKEKGTTVFDTSDSTFTISYATPPQIFLNRTQIYFGAATSGISTSSQSLFVDNNGGGTLNWSITDDATWLNCSPSSGTNAGSVTVSVDVTGLSAGTYTGTITVSDPTATNSPQTVAVTLNVYGSGQNSLPFGPFETPTHNSTVMSSISVSGWALDDIGVESVKIYRQAGSTLAYIGDAVFVEGARPDVELAYPGYPKNYQAGWGYMLLTNFLPNNGNGTFILYAKATDMEGQEVILGTKTIHCDNAKAVKPFGAIDTPTQGGTASGSSFINWGWVLTPQPNSIPTDGSTINVLVDSVSIGNPAYNVYRADIATLFPGYANSNGAVGYFSLDTTAYNNGVHTIAWIAIDSGGNADGIGSRYFSIQNTGSSRSGSKIAGNNQWKPMINIEELSNLPFNYSEPIKIKKGYGRNIQSKIIQADEENISRIEIRELEQLELQLSNVKAGYMLAGNKIHPLPIGSTLNTKNSTFSWIPGPGFYGNYLLVFIGKDQDNELSKKEILLSIIPKFGIKK